MTTDRKSYPDVSDVLAQKEERRRIAARRSFGEKIAIVEAMRERLAPLKQLREARTRAKSSGDSSEPTRR